MQYVDAETVAALGPARAVEAIGAALRAGLDPSTDPARVPVGLSHGQFLLMPSEGPGAAGVKVVTVAPDNPGRGLPRVHAAYLLFDRDTLVLRAVLDGTALTTLRTPAVSVAAVLPRLVDRAARVVVVGAGPQAVGHAATLAAVCRVESTTYLVRDPSRAAVPSVLLGSPAADAVLAAADVVVCATSARTPLFDSSVLRDDVVVMAVGSHEPDAREVDGALMARATVVVEDAGAAQREAGDVVIAIDEGFLAADRLVPMRDVVTGAAVLPADRPVVFKSVGMAWQDLVIAEAVVDAAH